MNKPNQPSEQLLESAPGSIEDEIMGGVPNQIEIDKDFSEKVTNAIEKAPMGDNEKGNNSEDVAASESNNDTHEPAKEWTEFLNQEISNDEAQNFPTPQKEEKSSIQDLSVLRDLLTENPHMAPAIKEALAKQGIDLDGGDPATLQRLDGMQDTINDLVGLVRGDRDVAQAQGQFTDVNDMYLDVNKDVPEHQKNLNDFFNNALLRDYPLEKIDRGILEGSNKAITAELDNYYNARLKAEGHSKSKGVPPSMNSNLGDIAPPPQKEGAQSYGDPKNKPEGSFAYEDARFSKIVNNLFSQ